MELGDEVPVGGALSLPKQPNVLKLLEIIRQDLKSCTSSEENVKDNDDDSNDEIMDFEYTYELLTHPETGQASIEYLDFSEWTFLTKIPESVFQLSMLDSLTLAKCQALKSFSSSIQNMHQLTDLNLSRCTALESIPSQVCSSLPRLKRLSLAYCTNLQELPESQHWTGLSELNHLNLAGCTQLQLIPEGLWNGCPNLVYLGLSRLTCIDPGLPPGIGQLQRLKTLNVRDCPRLLRLTLDEANNQSAPLQSLRQLHSILATGCPLTSLPINTLARLPQLQVISLDSCPNIPPLFQDKRVPIISLLRSLSRLGPCLTTLELVLWKALAWSEDPSQRATNRLVCEGIDIIIHRVIPFLMGDDPRITTALRFCFQPAS